MIEIKNLNFGYYNKAILKNVSLSIENKEFIGIIGPNGSGKSTLLKNLSKILSPESGLIYLNKRLLNDYSVKELSRILSVVPQDTSIQFNFTVYDLILMGRNPYMDNWGRVTREDKVIVEEVMELTDTSKLRDKKVRELSGGERQRVIIARALAQQPEILLLDEPTASLDINYQQEIFELLSHLNKTMNLTILLVSHDLNLTGQYCKRLILLKDGKIFAAGSPEEVLTPANIKKVYNTEVKVLNNPISNKPYVVLIPGKEKKRQRIKPTQKPRVHLICGGGSGKELMNTLHQQGYRVSTGVLNQGDSDWEKAMELGIPVVEIPPFAPICEKSLKDNVALIRESDVIVVADTPFGYGNIDNLKAISGIKDKPIIIVNSHNIKEKDYTDGLANKYWSEMEKRANCYSVKNEDEVLSYLNKL
ncbi:ABC transporter ATP-binding protein [Halothermothrix orenii]|uniref:ABC transporter related n=1 Tax=Halothermothrix orenii (strain H 168 / OCM 544 / DSM 9562) TaxID=373903 RepID=B8D028_HALOH|nr:ABC transporter ATP-binding protein [Halothermothrix orenii]ACL68782.1 ABC transporter related [Halothermothrix orenii H 168]